MQELEYEEIQGIILSGYVKKRFAAYSLLRIRSRAGAQSYLRWLEARLTTGDQRPEDVCHNVAITATGLRALGLGEETLATFPRELVEGMAGTAKRSEILGDTGASAPEQWLWGGPGNQVDVLLMVFAHRPDQLDHALQEHRRRQQDGLEEVYFRSTEMLPERREHFGFADGITQPQIKETGRHLTGIECLRAGEFILGYENEYGKVPFSPSVAEDPRANRLLHTNGQNGRRDLGRNGSYLVVRQLDQHVAAFWRSMLDQADGDERLAVRLAAKCVGRWPGGAPLTLSPDEDDPSLHSANDFLYRDRDESGRGCPIGAHIRRANPRDSLGSSAKESLKISARHAIIRRGRSYGPELPRFAADEGEEQERGLFFICVNANIPRQFEFIQQTWLDNPKFGGLHDGRDPLMSGADDNDHRIPGDPVRRRLTHLPRFTRVRGGGYFFLPSRAALRYLGQQAEAPLGADLPRTVAAHHAPGAQ